MNGAGSTSSAPSTLPAIGICGSQFAIGEGRVRGSEWALIGGAHPTEKSAPNIKDASIYRLDSAFVVESVVGIWHLADDKWPCGILENTPLTLDYSYLSKVSLE